MDKYTIYCTEAKTRKALELGAPINWCEKERKVNDPTLHEKGKCYKSFIPTAEQMIGWLETQISYIDVIKQENNTWLYIVYPDDKSNKNITVKGFSSRKEATLAAIDAALEYLSKNKK